MLILPEPLEFEWDKGNINKNIKKHNVTNQEAEQVFINKPEFIFKDDRHSTIEKRYMAWGITNGKRYLSIFFTVKKKLIRIISARDMKKKLKPIPHFKNEDEERDFWATADSSKYFDWSKAEEVIFPNLKPSTESISLRLPEFLLANIKQLANAQDVPYQSLMKIFLAERVKQELRK